MGIGAFSWSWDGYAWFSTAFHKNESGFGSLIFLLEHGSFRVYRSGKITFMEVGSGFEDPNISSQLNCTLRIDFYKSLGRHEKEIHLTQMKILASFVKKLMT